MKGIKFFGLQPFNAQQAQVALPVAVGISAMQSEGGDEVCSAIHVTVLVWTFVWVIDD